MEKITNDQITWIAHDSYPFTCTLQQKAEKSLNCDLRAVRLATWAILNLEKWAIW